MNNQARLVLSFLFITSLVGVTESNADESFPICGYAKRQQCVVDGDTFWYGGTKYRLFEIDTPEIAGGAKCQQEYETGVKAAYLLQSLLQSGIVNLSQHGKDRYGRTLVSVQTGKGDASEELLKAGLAERFGRKYAAGWCSN
jgi:endonuclease YncB( thermonuclease family)